MELTKEKYEMLSSLPTGNVADNNNGTPRQGVMDSGIKPLDPKCHLVGRAFPVQCFPGDNLALHQGIYAAKPGDVLVFDCHGYCEAGHFGERGIAGVIIDGSCRDAQDIVALGLPVFVRGINPSGTTKACTARLNVPIICGGVTVNPGDMIIGDCDGIVVVPHKQEDDVFAKAQAKFEKEIHITEELKQGKTTLELFGFDILIESLSAL